jgi:GR25 family glycosyltransferase involved in LPS biosynthesis
MKQYIIVLSALLVAGIFLHLVIFSPTGSFSSAAPVYYQSKIPSGESTSSSAGAKGSLGNPNDIFNSTLGFQEVFVVNLPERTDKRDAIAVQASLTNITFKLSPGVRGDTISEKAKPYGMEKLLPAEVGAWRAHLNVLQRVVENRISSTLILEDDADWDVSIKAQMTEFARGTRWLMNLTGPSHSPYGDGWDILWIGHCSAHSHHSDTRRWVIRKDLTVPPPNKRGSMLQPYDLGYWEGAPDFDTQTRIIYKAGYGFCFAGWAVSLRGAEKILHKLSMLPYELAVDLGVAEMCAHGTYNIVCLAPFPAYVGISKPAGNSNRGSDIVDGNGKGRAGDVATRDNAGGKFRKEPESERVVFSTRMNIPRLLVGETEFESNYANVTGQVRTIEEITSFTGTGHGEWLPEPLPVQDPSGL